MLNLKLLPLQHFLNISVKYLLNDQNEHIFIICITQGVEQFPRLSLYVPWKMRKYKNKSVYSFAGHPVVANPNKDWGENLAKRQYKLFERGKLGGCSHLCDIFS